MNFRKILIATTAISSIMIGSIVPTYVSAQSRPSYSAPSSSSSYSRPSYSAPSSSSSYSRPSYSAPSSSSSSSSYSRPSTTTSTLPSSSSTGSSYSRQTTSTPSQLPSAAIAGGNGAGLATTHTEQPRTSPSSTVQPPSTATSRASDRAASSSSLQQFREDQSRQLPIVNSSRQLYNQNPTAYTQRREEYIRDYHSRYPQVSIYTQHMQPSYGMFDNNFLTGMMLGYVGTSLLDRATWMNSQIHQPWYSQYRSDLERQAQSNEDLRRRLDEMDREMSRLRLENSRPAPSTVTLPEGVTPEFALAPTVVTSTPPAPRSSWFFWLVLSIIAGLVAFILVIIFKKYKEV